MKQFTGATAPRQGGKPGRKVKLSGQALQILDRLMADWMKHGAATLRVLRLERPDLYARLAGDGVAADLGRVGGWRRAAHRERALDRSSKACAAASSRIAAGVAAGVAAVTDLPAPAGLMSGAKHRRKGDCAAGSSCRTSRWPDGPPVRDMAYIANTPRPLLVGCS